MALAPHILLTVGDDLGWNDVSFHGSAQIPTPHLDALAAAGVTFDFSYVQPVCSPTRSSLLTGRHVIHTGIYDPDCGPGTTFAVPTAFSMLPEALGQLGYECHAIGKWHLGLFAPAVLPTARGFRTFFGYYGGAEDYYSHDSSGMGARYYDLFDDTQPNPATRAAAVHAGQYSTLMYAQRAVALIEDFGRRRQSTSSSPGALFLYLAWQAIHSPDQAPAEYTTRFEASIPDTPDGVGQHRRIVAGMVACLDDAMGNVTSALRRAGLADSTLIVFTTDKCVALSRISASCPTCCPSPSPPVDPCVLRSSPTCAVADPLRASTRTWPRIGRCVG